MTKLNKKKIKWMVRQVVKNNKKTSDSGFGIRDNKPQGEAACAVVQEHGKMPELKPHNSNNGATPAQMAGVGVENDKNKWEELLKRSLVCVPQRTKPAVLSQTTP